MKRGWFVQLSPDQPELYPGRAQNLWSKVEERSERDQENRECNDRVIMQQSEPTDDDGVLADAERNVRKRLWRRVRQKPGCSLRRVSCQRGRARE